MSCSFLCQVFYLSFSKAMTSREKLIPYSFSRRFIIPYGTMWTDIFCRNGEYDCQKISYNVEGNKNLILLDWWWDSLTSWINKLLQMQMWILRNKLGERSL